MEVEGEQSDFSTYASWAKSWHNFLFVLYASVMVVSLALYMCLVRAIARNPRKEVPIYFFLLFLFFASLVDDGIVIQQYITVHSQPTYTDFLCKLFTFTIYSSKILQATIIVAMIYYVWIAVELKRTRVEQRAKTYFWLIALSVLFFVSVVSLWPMSNVRAGAAGQGCYNIDASYGTERFTGWLYLVILPYLLPFCLCLWPVIRLGLKLRAKDSLTDVHYANTQIALVTGLGYFFFHLLYFSLMLGREAESLVLERSDWRKMLAVHLWYITRPMFALIGYGWHIAVPLAPFTFDSDLAVEFPGTWINQNKKHLRAEAEENRNSICMSDTASFSSASTAKTEQKSSSSRKLRFVEPDANRNSFENQLDYDPYKDLEACEYNRSSVV